MSWSYSLFNTPAAPGKNNLNNPDSSAGGQEPGEMVDWVSGDGLSPASTSGLKYVADYR